MQQASRPQGPAVVITHAVRTPIGKFMGSLSELSSADLGVHAVKGLLARSGLDPALVGEVLVGNGRQAGGGPNVARQISVRSRVPVTTPAWTVNMACGSGLKAIDLAWRAVRDGEAEVVLAGGTESMSRVPYLLTGARWGYRMGDQAAVDGRRDGAGGTSADGGSARPGPGRVCREEDRDRGRGRWSDRLRLGVRRARGAAARGDRRRGDPAQRIDGHHEAIG